MEILGPLNVAYVIVAQSLFIPRPLPPAACGPIDYKANTCNNFQGWKKVESMAFKIVEN